MFGKTKIWSFTKWGASDKIGINHSGVRVGFSQWTPFHAQKCLLYIATKPSGVIIRWKTIIVKKTVIAKTQVKSLPQALLAQSRFDCLAQICALP